MKNIKYILIAFIVMLLVTSVSYGQYCIDVENHVNTKYRIDVKYSNGTQFAEKDYYAYANMPFTSDFIPYHHPTLPGYVLVSFEAYTTNCNPTLVGTFTYGTNDHYWINHCHKCIQSGTLGQAVVNYYIPPLDNHYLGFRCYFN